MALESARAQESLYYTSKFKRLISSTEDLHHLIEKLEAKFCLIMQASLHNTLPLEMQIKAGIEQGIGELNPLLSRMELGEEIEAWKSQHGHEMDRVYKLEFEPASFEDDERVVVDAITKIVLGQKLVALQLHRDQIWYGNAALTAWATKGDSKGDKDYGSGLEKKLKELEGLQNLVKVYKEQPQFGNAGNPLEVTNH
jgi:hypothetical protein